MYRQTVEPLLGDMTMNRNHIRCQSAAQVERIAAANHVPHTHTAYAASVTLGEVVYWWVAA
jgi:hypothetical protein